jgi:dual specificity phosphatase 12
MGNVCDKIEDNLWLGDKGVYNKECPEYTRFQTIVSILIEEEVHRYDVRQYAEGRNWLLIPLEDSEDTDISSKFLRVIKHVDAALQRGDCVLIHCAAGVSRSTTMMAAYLMWKHRWSRDQTLDYIRARRSIIQPNDGFLEQLALFEGVLAKIVAAEQEQLNSQVQESQPSQRV